jgi:hypothetical protein
MGNPHCTFFVPDAEAVDLAAFGPAHEHHPLFPERTNVQVVSGPRAGPGSGCGSGSAARGSRSPRARPPARWRWRRRGGGSTGRRVTLVLDGGEIAVDWREDGVWMTGPTRMSSTACSRPPSWVRCDGPEGAGLLHHGCRLNAYETEAMKELAAAAGLGDAVIVNTCAVTAEAVRKARQDIRRLRRENPGARIIVTGCAAQTEPETFAAMAEVDHVVGNAEKMRPGPGPASPAASSETERVQVDDILSVRETAGHLIDGFGTRSRAYVQVQNGCDHRCTFCIIPYGRGNSRSVPAGVVVEQIRRLVDRGYCEVVLTGVDLTSWGADLPGAPRLGDLVQRILRLVPDLPRLRISSIDSIEVDER